MFINGIQQHATPTTNVRVEGFTQPILKLRVNFLDNDESVTKTLYMPEESSEISYQMKNTKRGYKARAFSFVPINQATQVVARPEVIVVPYATVPVISQTTTTTTTTTGSGNGTGVNVGINGEGVGINVSVGIGGNGGVYEETTTTTTTTTSGGVDVYEEEILDTTYGCPYPISSEDFREAKETIESNSFDDTRLSLAKQIIKSNCMRADQVKELVALMSFDDSKLALAKFAYGYTYDYGNYFKVSQALDFESSVAELNRYIDNYRW